VTQNYPFDKQYDPGEGITFNELTGILSGEDDPTVTDITDGRNDIPISTIYIRTGQAEPAIYVKADTGVNDWAFASLVGSNNGSGVLGIGEWKFDTNTTPPPNDKRFSFNNADITLATELYIDYQNDGGADLTNILNAITPPALIYCQNTTDATDGFVARITATASGATNVTYTVTDVTFLTLSGSLSSNRRYNIILSGLGGTGSAIDIQEDDVTVVGGATTLNFEGNLVGLTDNGGGKVTASFALDLQEDDGSVVGDTAVINLEGNLVSVTDEGNGKATIAFALDLQEDDGSVVGDTAVINLEGNLVSVTDEGNGKATIAFALDLQEDDGSVVSDTAVINLEGNLVSVTDEGNGKATISFSLDLQEDDGSVVGDTAVINFEGNLLSVTDEGGGKVTVAFALDLQEEDVSVNADTNIINFEGRLVSITNDGSGKVTTLIRLGVKKEGVLVDADVNVLDIIGPTTVTDNGDGELELDTNVSMDEIEDTNLTGLVDNDTLKFDFSELEWIRVPAPPPAPSGTTAIVQFIDNTIDVLSGNTTIPKDQTLPLITEGTEVWSQPFTPVLSTSTIRVQNSFTVSSTSQNMELIFALFEGTVCIGTVVSATVEKESGASVAFTFLTPSPGTSETIYSIRIGKVIGSPGSWFVNEIAGTGNNNLFDGTLDETGYSISELAIVGS